MANHEARNDHATEGTKHAATSNRPGARTVLITGAAGALAGTTADLFTKNGWRVALLARAHRVDALQASYPDAQVVAADLSDAEQTTRAVNEVERQNGHIDAVLNLVGGFAMKAAVDTEDADLDRMLSMNLATAFHVTRAALPAMLARGDGFVLGVSARAALVGGRRTTAYGAAKGAVTSYFRNLQAELEPKGIGVAILFPMGTIDTDANRKAMPDADPAGFIDRERLAEAIYFLSTRSQRDRIRELEVGVG